MKETNPIILSILGFFEKATSKTETAKSIKCLGRIFITFIYLVIIMNLYIYFKLSFIDLLTKKDYTFAFSYTLIFLYSVYCLVYFHYKACWVEPGYPERVTMKQ